MEYINYTLTKDANRSRIYVLTINKVPGIPCEYSIVFDNYEEFKKFENSNKTAVGMGAEVRFGKARNADKFLLRIGMRHDDAGFQKFVLVLESNDWIREHIESIASSLSKQAHMFEKRKLDNAPRRQGI